MKRLLPIGMENFREIREDNRYYIDKTWMICEFLQYRDKAALITRPRRFGKTLNMTMLREFFDITKDSREIFDGLAIMKTEYETYINSKPVLYFSFKDCSGSTAVSLKFQLANIIRKEYAKYFLLFQDKAEEKHPDYLRFYQIYEMLCEGNIEEDYLSLSLEYLLTAVKTFYQALPIVLIDEYDQPVLSSYEHGYRKELKEFFSTFYGSVLKGNEDLGQALLTGIQRVAKESIFSKLNNIKVYTVVDKRYSGCFGLNSDEAGELLRYYGLQLNDTVKQKYDGYLFYETEIYNPWSVLNYAESGRLGNYWINTSTNLLVKEALLQADDFFQKDFNKLLQDGLAEVSANLEISFIELQENDALWGLLVNSGYITVVKQIDGLFMTVRIPNDEVKSEFQKIVAEQANISNRDLQKMFYHLMNQDMEKFMEIYREIILSCTSYHDTAGKREQSPYKENPYHMLFLGMCVTLRDLYRVTSNPEAGVGRPDIRLESLYQENMHIIIEFKQGKNLEKLKEEALQQILDKKYFSGLKGRVLCLGIAHDIKKCEMAYKIIDY